MNLKFRRLNIQEYKNGTVSFNHKKSYEFSEKESKGSEFDVSIGRNISKTSDSRVDF